MTSPAGSIGIGVTLDASDLGTQITAAVRSALTAARNDARAGVNGINAELGRIDAQALAALGQAAQAAQQRLNQINAQPLVNAANAASTLAQRLSQINPQNINSAANAAGNLAQRLNQINPANLAAAANAANNLTQRLQTVNPANLNQTAQAAQQIVNAANAAAQAANNIGQGISPANINQLVNAIQVLSQRIGALNVAPLTQMTQAAQQMAEAVQRAALALQQIGPIPPGVLTGVTQLQQALAQANQRINDLEAQLQQLGQQSQNTGNQGQQAGNSIGEAFGGAAGKVAGLAAGVLGVGAAVEGIKGAIEQAGLNNTLQAQLDLTKEEAAEAGRITGRLYADNYGTSVEDVSKATGAVLSSLGNLADNGSADIEKLTAKALTLASTFELDVAESTQVVNQLIRQGFAKDATEGFDLVGTAFQRVPAAMREELPDLINEYGTFFKSIGFNGKEAFGALVNASQDGKIAMDKVGDAVKEFNIRVTNIGDKGAQEALTSLGLNSVKMSEDLLKGGDTARASFQKIIEGLRGIKDPTEQAKTSLALFGTPLEDLDTTQIPKFLDGLLNAGSAMEGFEGGVDRMGAALDQGVGPAIEKFKRHVQEAFVQAAGQAIQFMQRHELATKVMAVTIGVLVGALVTAKVAIIAYGIAIDAVALATKAWGAITKAATAIQKAFTAAFIASPIGLVVVAIAALAAGLYLFFTRTESGRRIFAQLMDAMKAGWEAVKNATVAAWEFIQPILQSFWSWIQEQLVPAILSFWHDVMEPAFKGIGILVELWWNYYIMPIFEAFKFAIGVIAEVVMFLWHNVMEPAFTAIGFLVGLWWNYYIMPIFEAFKFGIGLIVDVVMFWWHNVMEPAFNAVASVVSFWWNNIVQPVFNGFVSFIQGIVIPLVMFFWHNVMEPVFNGIGAIISFWWNNVVMPVFDAFKYGIGLIGEGVMFWWHNVVEPAWNTVGGIIKSVWETVIAPAWEGMKTGLRAIGDFFNTVVAGIGNKWNELRNLLAKPINFLINTVYNQGIAKAWNKVAEFIPGLNRAPNIDPIPEFAAGGPINGPGGVDNVLMWGSKGEHMLTVDEVAKLGGHNVVYAIRDMIARGVPFSWAGGQLISDLGRSNLDNYGAAVAAKGIGNVNPEGLFDKILPRYKTGGEIVMEPWMRQLLAGHEFAAAQNGKPYQWGGPTGVGSSFDCSGFMGSIAAAIVGGNPWQRYWATSSFAGYPQVGPQGFTRGSDGGMVIGVTDDPNGPGGGHTAGWLGPVGGRGGARVESGGALGNVHYGTGTDPSSFAAVYKLPIGANGFFDPGPGGNSGPSPKDQKSWLERQVKKVFDAVIDPVKGAIVSTIGAPPPEYRKIPPSFLDAGSGAAIKFLGESVNNLGAGLGGAWSKSKELLGDVGSAVNPLDWFDNGGLANGTGFMAKNTISPERILSPEQTKLFEGLVVALQSVASGSGVQGSGLLTAAGFQDGIAQLGKTIGIKVPDGTVGPVKTPFLAGGGAPTDANGQIVSDTKALLERTESSRALVDAKRFEQTQAVLSGISNLLTEKVLAPVIQTGMEQAFKSISADSAFQALGRSTGQVAGQLVAAAVSAATASKTTAAAMGGVLPGYTPGRDVHMFNSPTGGRLALSGGEAIMVPQWTRAVGGAAVVARMNAAARRGYAAGGVLSFATGGKVPAGIGSDLLGIDQSTAFGAILAKIVDVLVTALLKVIGIEIQVRDTMNGLAKDIRAFKGETLAAFDENGQLISDTSALVERTATDQATVSEEKERITKDILKGTIEFLVKTILVPVLQALSSSLIQGAGTAIGAAVGGPAGAIAGAVAGAALGAIAGVLINVLGEVISAGVDAIFSSFDSGGVATGMGLMPKNTIAPERVLSPRQTESFERLVSLLERGGNRTVQIGSMNVNGRDPAQQTAESLLSLLNS